MHFKHIKNVVARAALRGFTVIELMVTVTIVVLVTALIMIQYASFNNSVLLRNQAYLTAFDLREAQALAVSVKGRGGEFREEYGIYFAIDGVAPDSYTLFQDDEAYGDHTPARFDAGEAVGQSYRVDPRFLIRNICATNAASRTCYSNDPTATDEIVDPTLSNVAVSFKRPDFDAQFYAPAKSNIESVDIQFGAQSGSVVRTVTIYQTGQISVH